YFPQPHQLFGRHVGLCFRSRWSGAVVSWLSASGVRHPRGRGRRLGSERVIETRKHGNALAAITDVHVSDHKRARDAAKTQSVYAMQLAHRKRLLAREHASEIDERGHLQVDAGGDGVEGRYAPAQLGTHRKRIPIVETSLPKPSQRLFTPDHALRTPNAAERPEWDVARSRQVP